jgi:FkbM family methyltransferase
VRVIHTAIQFVITVKTVHSVIVFSVYRKKNSIQHRHTKKIQGTLVIPRNKSKAQAECERVYQWARPHIKNFKHAVDVGARQGFFARNLENDFKHTHCFDFRDKRKEFAKVINEAHRFTYHVIGLGESERLSHTTNTRVGRIKEGGTVAVPIRTLDSFNIADVGFIKYDIEGFETKAIKGSENTIKSSWPVVVVEQNRGDMDAVELLESWGYRCMGGFQTRNQDFLCVKE